MLYLAEYFFSTCLLMCIICSTLRPDFKIKGEEKDILILILTDLKFCFENSLCNFMKFSSNTEKYFIDLLSISTN